MARPWWDLRVRTFFYDALLPTLVPEQRLDWASSLDYALGSLGGGLLFGLCVWLTVQPQIFGLEDASQGVRFSFLLVAAWWLIFSLPLWLWVREPKAAVSRQGSIRAGIRQLVDTSGPAFPT